MSTKKYYPNGEGTDPVYDIGVGGISHISSWVGKQGKDISTFDIIWPIYGSWAGPE
jgi:hypothetical protein